MISFEQIIDVEKSLRNLDENETKRLIHRFQRKQTSLMVYLAAISEREEFNEDEQDIFFTTALVIWMTLIKNGRSPKKVKMKRIEELDNQIMNLLEKNADKDNLELENEARQLMHHQEPRLLEYAVQRCTERDENMDIRSESRSLMIFFLKVVLDGLLEVTSPTIH